MTAANRARKQGGRDGGEGMGEERGIMNNCNVDHHVNRGEGMGSRRERKGGR